jgi:hypothetical protein
MIGKILVVPTALLLSMFIGPAIAAGSPSQSDRDDSTINAAVDSQAKTPRSTPSTLISARKLEEDTTEEAVDCYYEENAYRSECRDSKSQTR